VNVLLVDDHTLFRSGLRFLLADLDRDLRFLEAGSCDEALAHAGAGLDLVLLDLQMPGSGGLETLQRVKAACESAVVVVLSSEEDPRLIRAAIHEGAGGFIPKTSTPAVLLSALQLVLAGGVYLPPHALRDLDAPALPDRPAPFPDARPPAHPVPSTDPRLPGLSERQREVITRAVQGKPNKVIARELKISEGTVKAHLSSSFRVLGVANRTEAVYMAAQLGLMPPSGQSPT